MSSRLIWLVPMVLTACGSEGVEQCIRNVDPDALEWVDPQTTGLLAEPDVRVLTVNVGNGVETGSRYDLRLRYQAYEDALGDQIAELQPHVIGIQEVISRTACERAPADEDESQTCFDVANRADQVRRLVGDHYSIVCDAVASVDCLAVHTNFGRIEGLVVGGYDPQWRHTEPMPAGFEPCSFTAGECQPKLRRCDVESSVLWADVLVFAQGHQSERMRMVHVHPAAFGDACRENQMLGAYERVAEVWDEPAGDRPTMILGDWNFDPDRLGQPVEELLYSAHVGPQRRLRDHDERTASCGRVKTSPSDLAAIDRVVTDFGHGFCRVFHESHVSLDGDEPRGRFDAAFDAFEVFPGGSSDPGRMDHRAVVCDLAWPE